MKRILLLAALWLGAQTAGAADWRPVIGLTGQAHFPVEATVTSWPGTWYLGGAGTGSQVEIGIRNDQHEFYAAWHTTAWMMLEDGNSFMVRTDSATWIASDEQWQESQKEQRVRIGYRYWPTGAAGGFAPVLGVAVGGGSSRLHTRSYDAITQYHQAASGAAFSTRVFSDESRMTRTSDICVGALAELGVAFRPLKNTELLGLTHVEVDAVRYKGRSRRSGFIDHAWRALLIPTLGLQLRYTFAR